MKRWQSIIIIGKLKMDVAVCRTVATVCWYIHGHHLNIIFLWVLLLMRLAISFRWKFNLICDCLESTNKNMRAFIRIVIGIERAMILLLPKMISSRYEIEIIQLVICCCLITIIGIPYRYKNYAEKTLPWIMGRILNLISENYFY